MVNWVGTKKTNKAYEEAERKKREKILEKIKKKRKERGSQFRGNSS